MDYERALFSKVVLAIGFGALAVGAVAAYTEPASGYELSIYRGTPALFWFGVGTATLCALGVSLFTGVAPIRALALALAGSSFTAIVGLPILRNYHYYGTADALTHLGWARGVAGGETDLLSLLYPGIHTFAVFVGDLWGYPLTRSMLYVVVVLAVVFFVSVPLLTRALTDEPRAVVVATFSAFMLLPINNLSTFLLAHPASQAILFTPLVVYLLVQYLRSDPASGLRPTALGATLLLASVALLLYHPQIALDFLLVLGAVVGVQAIVRWRGPGDWSTIASTRPLYAQTGLLTVVFLMWSTGHDRFQSSASIGIQHIAGLVTGQTQIATAYAQRGTSLVSIGSGLEEIFLKLFLVMAVYSLFAGVLMLASLRRRLAPASLQAFSRLLIFALAPLTVLFAVYFLASIGTQAFRHLGFIMVFVTVLGAIGLARSWRGFSGRVSAPAIGGTIALVLAVALVLSTLAFFPSPWFHKHSAHVTEMQLDGYETTFDYADQDSRILGIRGGPERHAESMNAGQSQDGRYGAINETEMTGDPSAYYDGRWYLATSRLDRDREVVAYEELRYSEESFEAVRTQRSVNHVLDNGEFDLYYVVE